MSSRSEIVAAFEAAVPKVFEPCAYFDVDGKCIEFFASDEDYYAERLDDWVTVYRGEKTGKIVGSQIKEILKLVAENPGLDIEVEDGGQLCLAHYFRACGWKQGDAVAKKTYKLLIESAGKLTVDLPKAA